MMMNPDHSAGRKVRGFMADSEYDNGFGYNCSIGTGATAVYGIGVVFTTNG